ncbi:glycosyl transferase [Chromatiaceae bacterium AAb-1]|nr:glycosyl transferase [Chromatiaceae bacterium AAb-1]
MSSSFNPLERAIARILSRLPFIKRIAKRCYAVLVYLLKRKGYSMRLSEGVQALHHAGNNTFFGYYDKSPVNPESRFIIYQRVNAATSVQPNNVEQVTLCLSRFPENEPVLQLVSKAFNWQQGTKLQWINNSRFIFNDFDSNKNSYIARIVDTEQGEIVSKLEKPVYDCFADKFALSLSFERLAVYSPDYGYFAKQVAESDLLPDSLDGIFYVDLQTGAHKLQLSLETIAAFAPSAGMALAKHTVNHLMISPDGTRFMFIHRWFVNGRRFDRLLLSDINSGQLKVIASNDMVSHCFWYGSDKILSYLRGKDNKDSYWIIDVETLLYTRLDKLNGYGDGHPHIHGEWLITDTYPDKSRMQHLLTVNLRTEQVKELGEFFHGFRYDGETRCDLHPRFSFDGQFVFFDSVSSGDRRLCWLEFRP